MNISLYIDTKSLNLVKVGLKKNGLEFDYLEDKNKFGSQVLLVLIQQILKKNNLNFSDLSSVELEVGEGSFTGLRVGASVAQAIAFALGLPLNGDINKPLNLVYT